LAAGVPLKSISLAHINGKWVYPGDEHYDGLLVENDLTEEAFGRGNEIRTWIEEAHAVAGQLSEPQVRTGAHCSYPFECGFRSYCESDEPLAKYPVEWLPRLRTAALKEFIETNLIEDLRHVPDEYLSELQQRVKAHTISGSPFFDQAGAAAELAHYNLAAYFLDFETSQFAVPIWKGTRPYQQIPFQFSRHRLWPTGELDHLEFLDLSGDDPSRPLAESLIDACEESGPVFVYNASFEGACITELADRFPELNHHLLGINARLVDLLPIARRYYYHPSQYGSWALKWLLPTIATDLGYDKLTGVRDGSMAMNAYLEAIYPQTAAARKDEIRRQLLDYCRLDTYALVRLWQYFAGRKDLLG
jgi:hypothetical protein